MSRQLREHIRRQLRVLLENKEKGYIPKDDKFKKGSLEDFNFRDKVADKPRDSSIRNQYKTAMKSAIDDMDGEVPSLGEVLKKMREDAKSEEFKKVIQKKQKEIKEDEITEDDVTKAKKGALEAKIVADALAKEAKEKEEKLKNIDEVLTPAEKAAQKSAIDLANEKIKDATATLSTAKDPLEKKAAQDKLNAAKEDLAQAKVIKESKKKLEEYIKEMIPSLLEADDEEELEGEFPEEEGQEDDAFVPNHYKPEFIPREAEQTLERLGLTPIDRYVDFVNFMDSTPKSLKIVLVNGNSFLLYFDETGLALAVGAEEIDLSDDRNLPKAQQIINDLLMGPVDAPEEEGEEDMGAEEEVPAEEEPAAEEEPTEEEPAEEPEA